MDTLFNDFTPITNIKNFETVSTFQIRLFRIGKDLDDFLVGHTREHFLYNFAANLDLANRARSGFDVE